MQSVMTLRKQILMRKFFESMFGARMAPYLFRFDQEPFAQYNSLLIGKTLISLQ